MANGYHDVVVAIHPDVAVQNQQLVIDNNKNINNNNNVNSYRNNLNNTHSINTKTNNDINPNHLTVPTHSIAAACLALHRCAAGDQPAQQSNINIFRSTTGTRADCRRWLRAIWRSAQLYVPSPAR